MPKLNDYTSRVGTPTARSGRVQTRQQTTDYRVAPVQDPTGQALAQAGQVAANIGFDMLAEQKKRQEDQATAKAASSLSGFGLQMERYFEESRNNAPIDGKDFTPNLIKGFDTELDKLIESEKDDATKAKIRQGAERLKFRLMEDAIKFESRAAAEAKRIELDQTADNFSQMAYMRPTLSEDTINEFSAVVQSMSLPEAEKAKILKSGQQRIAASAATKLSEIMPEKIVEDLKGKTVPSWAKHLDVSQIEQIRSRAERRIEQGQAVQRYSINRRYDDAIASLSTYGTAESIPTREELIAANGLERGQIEYERLSIARQLGTDIQNISGMSAQQIEILVRERQPKAGSTDFEVKTKSFQSLLGAIQNRNERLQKDPAAYVIGAIPEVLQSHNEMLLALSSGDEAQRADAIQNYSVQMAAAQERMGVQEPMILTGAMKDHYIRELTTSPVAVNGVFDSSRSIGAKVSAMRESWGSFWPQVYGEIANKLPASINVIASTPNKYARDVLSQIAGVKDEQIFAALPQGTSQGTIGQDIVKNDVFSQFATSFGYQNGGFEVVSNWYKELARLSAVYIKQGSDSTSAAAKAVSDVIGESYSFVEAGSTGGFFSRAPRNMQYNLRVPKSELPDMVQRGLSPSIDQVIKSGVMPFADKTFIAQTEQEAKERTIEIIKSSSFWIPTENEDGATLFVMGDDSIPRPVFNSSGVPVKFKWSEIRSNGNGEIRQAPKTEKEVPQMKQSKPSYYAPVKGRIF